MSEYIKVEQFYIVITGVPYEDCQEIQAVCFSSEKVQEFMDRFMDSSGETWIKNELNGHLEYEDSKSGRYLTFVMLNAEDTYTKINARP